MHLATLRGHQTLEQMVYQALRDRIAGGDVRPGQKLSASEAARQLGVSRVPVIHALRRLASEGFVVIHPHRDVMVADPSPDEIRGSYLIMAELEGLAAREALPRLDAASRAEIARAEAAFRVAVETEDADADFVEDRAFHSVLWRHADIKQLEGMLDVLWDQGAYFRSLFRGGRRFARDRVAEHARISRAVDAGDADALVAAIRDHRLRALDRVVLLLSEDRQSS
jgi:DNA-binding GntR family transcriptional regulator